MEKLENYSANKGENKNGKNHYYFNITSLKNYSKFNKIIGCTSPKKSLNLLNLIKNTRASKNHATCGEYTL